MLSLKEEKEKITRAAFLPLLFVGVLWLLHLLKAVGILNIDDLGILPRDISGLRGIVFSPLIHDDFLHLINNSVPLVVLGTALFYFYSDLAFKVLALIWLLGGAGTWLIGREAYHIGASGVIFGLAAFLFFSGILRNVIKLTALSLLVVFLYGSMVWQVFPTFTRVSWEGHLAGGITGCILAFVYRKVGPQEEEKPDWMNEPDDESDDLPASGEETEAEVNK